MNNQEVYYEWGSKRLLYENQFCFIDLLTIKPGGFSSRHKHEWLFNHFHWIQGELIIRFFAHSSHVIPKQWIPIKAINTNQLLVPPEEIHQFYNPSKIEYAQVVEVCYVGGIQQATRTDIIRYSERGCDVK